MSGGMAEHIRGFVAVALPDRLLDKVKETQDHLDSRLPRQGRDGVRWTSREQLHLTLRFFGNIRTADLDALQSGLHKAVESASSFELGLAGLGCFPSPNRPNVIWLGLQGDLAPLRTLQTHGEAETGRFGSHSEPRPFKPHLTI